jgi:hypothetical protein
MKKKLIALAALSVLGAPALAPAQSNIKPPKVQLWIDVSTGGMAGMPDMDVPTGLGGGLGAMMGGGARPGTATQSYGSARGMNITPARALDIALYNSLKPGVEAQQLVPAGLKMGDSLPLVPPPSANVPEEKGWDTSHEYNREKPRGRVLIYWGCGDTVRKGQPKVIDLSRAGQADFGNAFSGRYAADRGARVTPRHALYPNERTRMNVPQGASLAGEHKVQGDGVPASMKFTLAAAQDLMPAIALQTRGQNADSIAMSWAQVPNARAYYLHAIGQAGDDMVMWSSAETGDTGSGLFDYLPNATIDKWVKDSVLLKPETTACAIPKGIFAKVPEGQASVRMIAYGSESNFAYPPRPNDPKAVWEPEWAVRVRVKANTMAMLGVETSAAAGGLPAPAGRVPQAAQTDVQAMPTATPAQPTNPVQAVIDAAGAVNTLRGLFGR